MIRVPLWGLRKRQSFHDGLCVAELLVAVRQSLSEAERSGAGQLPKLPGHMKLARRIATDIAGDNVPVEQHLTNPKAQDTPEPQDTSEPQDMPEASDRPPAKKRDGTRWLPRQRRTPSWEAAYNTACVYAALGLDHRVVVSLRRAINNPDCEMHRPWEWISRDPDFSCLKASSKEFKDFLDAQERKDYPAAAANGASHSSVSSPEFASSSTTHHGYVGIGRVVEGPIPISGFIVINGGGPRSPLESRNPDTALPVASSERRGRPGRFRTPVTGYGPFG